MIENSEKSKLSVKKFGLAQSRTSGFLHACATPKRATRPGKREHTQTSEQLTTLVITITLPAFRTAKLGPNSEASLVLENLLSSELAV
jgi:hypothetical protein